MSAQLVAVPELLEVKPADALTSAVRSSSQSAPICLSLMTRCCGARRAWYPTVLEAGCR